MMPAAPSTYVSEGTIMLEDIIGNMKTAFAWLWNWVTVLAGVLVGVPAALFEALDALGGADLTPLLPAGQALKIITMVAVAKALYATLRTKAA
jgi:hypothetical protein